MHKFKVGDRVRDNGGALTATPFKGVTGVVVSIEPDELWRDDGHYYMIKLDSQVEGSLTWKFMEEQLDFGVDADETV